MTPASCSSGLFFSSFFFFKMSANVSSHDTVNGLDNGSIDFAGK